MASELKPCLLCEGEAKLLRRSGAAGRVCPSKWYRERVECKVCGLTTREYKSPGAATRSWNTRSTAVAPVSPIENQHTVCAGCFVDKPTPLRRDEMGGYVCLTCVDKRLDALSKELLAPDATGQCGELETIGFVPPMFAEGKGANYNDIFRSVSIAENYTAVVTRSQAVELLAAERAENTRLQSENDAQADQISELQMTPWPEWATKVLAVIRKRSGYDGYGDAIEGVDLPAELDECIAAIEADNAALTARVKELTQLLEAKNA